MFRHRVWWLCRLMWWFADKLSGFGTVSEIFVQYFIPQMKVMVDFPNYAENLQNSPFVLKLTFFSYFP